MVTEKIFESALGVQSPWHIAGIEFEPNRRQLSIRVDFEVGSRFAVAGETGEHPMHDTVTKQYRHLNFFQYECALEVRVPRVKLPDGSVRQVSPPWAGKLSGFTLLFEAFVLALCREMTFSGVARVCGLSKHRVMSICERYVDTAVAAADFSEVRRLAIDETSRAKGHDYVTLFADAERRAVLFVAEGNEAATVEGFEANLRLRGGKPTQIEAVSMDMLPAFIKGVTEHFPNAQITFDKFHVIAHASTAVDATRRIEQKVDPSIKGLRWALLKDRSKLRTEQRADLDELVAHMTTKRIARAWLYREQLRDIMTRRQPNVVRALLKQWCTNVMRSKVEPMKEVAAMIRNHSRASSPGSPRARPTASSKPSTVCFRPPSARLAVTSASALSVPLSSYLHDRRETRLLPHQPLCPSTHLEFNRGCCFFVDLPTVHQSCEIDNNGNEIIGNSTLLHHPEKFKNPFAGNSSP